MTRAEHIIGSLVEAATTKSARSYIRKAADELDSSVIELGKLGLPKLKLAVSRMVTQLDSIEKKL